MGCTRFADTAVARVAHRASVAVIARSAGRVGADTAAKGFDAFVDGAEVAVVAFDFDAEAFATNTRVVGADLAIVTWAIGWRVFARAADRVARVVGADLAVVAGLLGARAKAELSALIANRTHVAVVAVRALLEGLVQATGRDVAAVDGARDSVIAQHGLPDDALARGAGPFVVAGIAGHALVAVVRLIHHAVTSREVAGSLAAFFLHSFVLTLRGRTARRWCIGQAHVAAGISGTSIGGGDSTAIAPTSHRQPHGADEGNYRD